MEKKPKFLKGLLTTASALAVIASASSAMGAAASSIVVNNAGETSANHYRNQAAPGVDANYTNGNRIIVTGVAQTVDLRGALSVPSINFYGHDARPVLVGNAANQVLGDFINDTSVAGLVTTINGGVAIAAGGNANAKGNIQFTGANTVSLTASNISALRQVDFNNQAGTFKITGAASNNLDFTANLLSTGGDNGTLEIDADNVKLSGTFAAVGTAVKNLKINNGKSAILNNNLVLVEDVLVEANGKLTVAANKNVTAHEIKGAGNVMFEGASKVIAQVGDTALVTKVTLGAGEVEFNKTSYKAGTTELVEGSIAKFSGNAAPYTVETNFVTSVDGEGSIKINGQDLTLKGSIGAKDKRVKEVNLGGKTLTISGADNLALHALDVKGGAAGSKVAISSGTFVINSNFGDNTTKLAEFKLVGDKAGVASKFTLEAGAQVHATAFDLGAVDNTLEMNENSYINGAVTTSKASNGTLDIKGDTKIDGDIGTGVAPIKAIKFATPGAGLITKAAVINTNDAIEFAVVETGIGLTNTNDITISPAIVAKTKGGAGAISANSLAVGKVLTFTNKISSGAAYNPEGDDLGLGALQLLGGGTARFSGSAQIDYVDFGNSEAVLELNAKDVATNTLAPAFAGTVANVGYFEFRDVEHDNNKGSLVVSEEAYLASSFGTKDNKAKEVKFNANKHLILEDGVDLYAGAITSKTATEGKLVTLGSSVIDAEIGKTSSINSILVTGLTNTKDGKAGTKTADFLQNVTVSDKIVISQDAKAIFRGDVKTGANGIIGAGAGLGTVSFANVKAAKIEAVVGKAASELKAVEFAGSDLEFTQALTLGELQFVNNGKTTVTLNKLGTLDNAKITTTSKSREHNLVLKGFDATLNQSVGSADNNFGDIVVDGNKALTVNTKDVYATLKTSVNKQNDVLVTFNGATILAIGEASKEFSVIQFDTNATVKNGTYAEDIFVGAAEVTLEGDVKTSNQTLIDNASHLKVAGSGAFASKVEANAANQGDVTFSRDVAISNTIGTTTALRNVSFDGNTSTAKSVAATAIKVGAKSFKTTADNVKLSGATTFAGSTLDLNTRKLTLDNAAGSSVTGNATIALEVSADGASAGQLVVDGAASVLNLNAANSLSFNVTDNSALPGSAGRSYTVMTTTNGAKITNLDAAKTVQVADNRNGFVVWTYNNATNVLEQKNNASEKLLSVVKSQNNADLNEDVKLLASADNTGSAQAVVNDLSKIADDKKVSDAVTRLTNPIVTSGEVLGGINNAVESQVRGRSVLVGSQGVKTADAGTVTGMSAGENAMFGAWVMPFYNQATKKNDSKSAGYEAKSAGATIGADAMVNADLTLGAAFSYIKTDAKHKGKKAGDKTQADTYVISVYGTQQITNEMFVQGSMLFGSSNLKNKEKRITSTGNQIATGKYDSTSYGVEALFGYRYDMNGVNLTPMAGFNYARVNDGGYVETGTTAQNLTVKKKAADKFNLIAGGSVDLGAIAMDGFQITPEAHAFVKHDLIGKSAKVDVKLDGLSSSLKPKSTKVEKTSYSAGLGLNSKVDMFDLGVGYDAEFAKKYVAHQGTLKVRVNF